MVVAGQAKGLAMDFDSVIQAKMQAVEQITGRPLIVYAVDMSNGSKTANNPILGLINYDDKDAFIEAFQNINGDKVDVLLQSPGGLAEASESLVQLLRNRFTSVRFIVPHMAKSAATMLAMSGDELVLDISSEFGPIDPQMGLGTRFAPAQAILDQFEQAKTELQSSPGLMPAWLPILQQLGPSLLQECTHYIALAEELVSNWLEAYMFKGDPNAHQRAGDVASKLNDHRFWRSHNRRIDMAWLQNTAGLKVEDLTANPTLHERVRGLHLALNITFNSAGAFKIVQNSRGNVYVGIAQTINVQLLQAAPLPMPAPPQNPQPGTPPGP